MENLKAIANPAQWLTTTIEDFIQASPENTLKNQDNERAWADPLVGFSRGDDPLYEDFKATIGDFYWTPLEIFHMTFPEVTVSPDRLTIISWILPQTDLTRADNRRQATYPAERWVRSRIHGEEFNDRLRDHVAQTLTRAGIHAPRDLSTGFTPSSALRS